MALPTEINLSQGVWQRWQTAKDIVNQNINSLTNSAQQVGHSLKQTVSTKTDQAIDTVTTTLEQAKASLEQSWQTAAQVKSTTSTAVQEAIASSFHDWLTQHPIFFKLVQILGWAANHPIISFVILLLALALFWSLIKAIVRLIETASWSILQVPLKLISALLKISWQSLTKVSSFAVQRINNNQTTENLPTLLPENSQINKQQRLAEISHRLEEIQQEQKQLLQEAADLIAVETIDLKFPDLKLSKLEVGDKRV